MDDQPNKSLPLSDNEVILIDSVIEDMNRLSKRLNIDTSSVRRVSLLDKEELDKLDKLIADCVDKLRPVMKIDFVEKLHDRLHWKIWQPDSIFAETMSYLALRLSDTMSYVTALTKKYRGMPCNCSIDENAAKMELKNRGLWKK